MLEEIKKIAGQISENYILKDINMTSAIAEAAKRNKLNTEIIKRICELANQNTYLSLFSSTPENRGNISFDLADSEKVINKLKEHNMGENDYLTTPTDYRMGLADVLSDDDDKPAVEVKEDPVIKKIRELSEKVKINEKLKALLSTIKSLESSEKSSIENNILKVSNDCKALVFNGESFGDMAKLALRFTKEKGFNLEKTAKLYTVVQDYLKNKGFNVKEGLTKISSMKTDINADIFKPLEEYHRGLMKIAGFAEMRRNLETITENITKTILEKEENAK